MSVTSRPRRRRAAASGPLTQRSATALAAAIRAGRHDGDLDLHARLLADAAARTAIANPKALGGAG